MTTILLIILVLTFAIGASRASSVLRMRELATAKRAEDREYLESCLNRERTHDYPFTPDGSFQERTSRGRNG